MKSSCAVLLLALGAIACGATPHWYVSGEPRPPHWGYDAEEGPEHWGSLSPEFRLADEGREQSPIDIAASGVQEGHLPAVDFRYRATHAHWVNDGHTLQHAEDGENHLIWEGQRWDLHQYHVHMPSEHTVDGFHASAELHFVHTNEEGEVLVIAVMVIAGEDHADMLVTVPHLPTQTGGEADLPVVRDPTEWLPNDRAYWSYHGSFTTPPCTEGVIWMVMQDPVTAPQEALRQVGRILGRNNRPTQPLNGRLVTTGG
jgi:carbonic anhydrase